LDAVVGFMAGLLGLGGGGILVFLLASIFTYQGIKKPLALRLPLDFLLLSPVL